MATKTYRKIELPIVRPLICLRGDTLRSSLFKHLQPDGVTPVDLSGATITCKGALSNGTLVDLSAYLVTDLVNGKYRVIVPPSVTNGATPWPEGLGSYDISITDTLGVITTYYCGSLGLKEGEYV